MTNAYEFLRLLTAKFPPGERRHGLFLWDEKCGVCVWVNDDPQWFWFDETDLTNTPATLVEDIEIALGLFEKVSFEKVS
jgi:hypothetical protein